MNSSMAWAGVAMTLGVLAAPGVAWAETPPSVSIRQAMRGGSGCVSGRAPAALTGDYERLLVMDGEVGAHAGPGVPLSEGRAFCQLTIELEHTPGWSYAVSSVSGHRGRTDLDDDVTARLTVERWFTGYKSDATSFEVAFTGPTGGPFFRREPVQSTSPWSPCDATRPLNIKTSVLVSKRDNPQGLGSIAMTPSWGVQVLRLHWRKC
jgi:hypothetical protein